MTRLHHLLSSVGSQPVCPVGGGLRWAHAMSAWVLQSFFPYFHSPWSSCDNQIKMINIMGGVAAWILCLSFYPPTISNDTSRASNEQQPDNPTKAQRIWRSWCRQGNAIPSHRSPQMPPLAFWLDNSSMHNLRKFWRSAWCPVVIYSHPTIFRIIRICWIMQQPESSYCPFPGDTSRARPMTEKKLGNPTQIHQGSEKLD